MRHTMRVKEAELYIAQGKVRRTIDSFVLRVQLYIYSVLVLGYAMYSKCIWLLSGC